MIPRVAKEREEETEGKGERVPDAFTGAHCSPMIARETASRTATVVVTVQARAAVSHGMKHGPWCDSWTAARSDGADPVATGLWKGGRSRWGQRPMLGRATIKRLPWPLDNWDARGRNRCCDSRRFLRGILEGLQRCDWRADSDRISWLFWHSWPCAGPRGSSFPRRSWRCASTTPLNTGFHDKNPNFNRFDPRRYFYFSAHDGIWREAIATYRLDIYV